MKSSDKILAGIIATYVFLALRPYFTWSLPDTFFMYLQILPVLIFATRMELGKQNNIVYFVAFFALFLYVCLLRGYNVYFSSLILSLSIIPFVEKGFTVQSYDYFRKLLAVVLGFSLVEFILLTMGAQIGTGKIIPPLNEAKDYNYISYLLLVVPTSFSPRFHGPFDEPGVVGTVGLVVLVVNKYKLKDIWNLIIFVACVASLSFAFFGGSIVYLAVRLFSNRNKSLAYLLVGATVFYLVTANIPFFKENIYDRMEYDQETGKLTGDTRTTVQMDDYFASIRFSSIYWWGTSDPYALSVMAGSASYKKAIMQYGIIFLALYCFLIWLFAVHYKLKKAQLLVFIALMLVNIYQRPNLLSFSYIFLYMSYIKKCACENKNEKRLVIHKGL